MEMDTADRGRTRAWRAATDRRLEARVSPARAGGLYLVLFLLVGPKASPVVQVRHPSLEAHVRDTCVWKKSNLPA
jgi:hypothetical protein